MRNLLLFFILLVLVSFGKTFSQSVGVGTTVPNDDIAILHIKIPDPSSRIQGILLPQVSTTDLSNATFLANITSAGREADGLLVYDTTDHRIKYYNANSTLWIPLESSSLSGIYSGSGTVASNTSVGVLAGNTLTFTGNNVDIFNVDTTTLSVDALNNRVGIGTAAPNNTLEIITSDIAGFSLEGDGSQTSTSLKVVNPITGSSVGNANVNLQSDGNNAFLSYNGNRGQFSLVTPTANNTIQLRSDTITMSASAVANPTDILINGIISMDIATDTVGIRVEGDGNISGIAISNKKTGNDGIAALLFENNVDSAFVQLDEDEKTFKMRYERPGALININADTVKISDLVHIDTLIAINAFTFLQNGTTPTSGQVLTTDGSGNASWQSLPTGGNIIFDTVTSGLIAPVTTSQDDNFVVGSNSLDDITGTNDNSRMFFDKGNNGAFRSGTVSGVYWDQDSIGASSFAVGQNTVALGDFSIAGGFNSRAGSTFSVALGNNSKATSTFAFSMGNSNLASGSASATFGSSNTSSGANSFVTGTTSRATASQAVAMGNSLDVSGANAFAAGDGNTVSGTSAAAFGTNTLANGNYSFTAGLGSSTHSVYETALGIYNTTYTPASATSFNSSDRLFVLGNGTASSSRSNALVVLKDAKTGIGNINPVNQLDVAGDVAIGASYAGVKNVPANGLIVEGPVGVGDFGTSTITFPVNPNVTNGASLTISGSDVYEPNKPAALELVGSDNGANKTIGQVNFIQRFNAQELGRIEVKTISSATNNAHMLFHTTGGGSTTPAIAERMRITSEGTVGIGTTNPVAAMKLHIANTGAPTSVRIESDNSNSSNLEFYSPGTATVNRDWQLEVTAGDFRLKYSDNNFGTQTPVLEYNNDGKKGFCSILSTSTGQIFGGSSDVIGFNNQIRVDGDYYTHSTSTNNDDITVLQDGWYKISYMVTVRTQSGTPVNTDHYLYGGITVNGSSSGYEFSESEAYVRNDGVLNRSVAMTHTFIVELSQNDVVTLQCVNNSSSNVSLVGQRNYIMIEKL